MTELWVQSINCHVRLGFTTAELADLLAWAAERTGQPELLREVHRRTASKLGDAARTPHDDGVLRRLSVLAAAAPSPLAARDVGHDLLWQLHRAALTGALSVEHEPALRRLHRYLASDAAR